VKGIEPSCAAWEAAVLPLNYTRNAISDFRVSIADCNRIRRWRANRPSPSSLGVGCLPRRSFRRRVERWTFSAANTAAATEISEILNHQRAGITEPGYSDHGPPKSLLNDLNKRPGKVAALSGRPGTWFANGHCAPPWTWQAAVGTLSAGKSMS
jgi:hypothetical protein